MKLPTVSVFLLSTLGLAACGSFDDSLFSEGGENGSGDPAAHAGSPFGAGIEAAEGTDPSRTNLASAACASSEAAATLAPVNLVFMFDKSGSMGDGARTFECPSFEATCSTYQVNGASKTICAKRNGGQIRVGTSGQVTQNGVACPEGNVAGAPAALCGDVNGAGCTQTVFNDPTKRWTPATNALKAFFADARSAGIAATLQFFPQLDSDGDAVCSAASYRAPAVGLTTLPNATAFAAAIGTRSPKGSTPTDIALAGAYEHAKTVKAAHATEGVAVVLVTDGYPNSCADSSVSTLEQVKTAAQNAARDGSVPLRTYVIGIGDGLSNLNEIAAAGGTTRATLVSTTSPAQTASDFQSALEAVRGSALPCDVALPSPPDGKQLDVNAVNVDVIRPTSRETLTYDKDCAGGTGWHYDNANAPSKVVLCTSTCTAVRENPQSRLSISFGCATKGGVIR